MRRLLQLFTGTAFFVSCVIAGATPTRAASPQFILNFDQGESLAPGTRVTDVSGEGNNGSVLTDLGGEVTPANGAAVFPGPCSAEPCPNAVIKIPSSATLNPGTRPFEWGAEIRLRSTETADGQNIIQKGTYGAAGGQWKLQVDKASAKPSCIVSGPRNGTYHRVVVRSPTTIADNAWHKVTCRRTNTSVSLSIDGTVRATVTMTAVTVATSAAITIGGKSVTSYDNDQFQGRLDNVFMQLL